jgi:TolA-binding protein
MEAAGNETAIRATPFATEGQDAGKAAVAAGWTADAGRDALRAGLPNLAQDYFNQALASPGLDGAARDGLNLDLAMAWLALGQVGNASAALSAVGQKDTDAYRLRAGLVAARSGRWTEAAAGLAQVNVNQMPATDRPWYYVGKALIAEQGNDAAAAQAAWQQAVAMALTPMQKAQFEAAQWRSQLMMNGQATPENAATLAQRVTDYQGLAPGVQFAKEYAIVEERLGQHDAAVSTLSKLLANMPNVDPDTADSVRLLLATLDPLSSASEGKLIEVLQGYHMPMTPEEQQTQEIALTLLEHNRDTAGDLAGLQKDLDALTTPGHKHPLQDRIYLVQARLALKQGRLTDAAASAKQLLDEYPSSPAHQDAWRLLAEIAWRSDPPRYRDAADYLHRLRAELPDGPERTRLAGLLADSYFLSGDYADAADAYTALLTEANPPIPRGALLLRAVQSDILAGQLDAALRLDEDAVARAEIAAADRWPAEWNVLSALRDNGREQDAFKHLDQLLGTDQTAAALPPELRLRLRWLAARLAVDVADASMAQRVQALQADLDALPDGSAAGLDQATRDALQAHALLLEGQAANLAGQAAAYHAFFTKLRDKYPGTDAAIYSMFFEAQALAAAGKTADAQGLMSNLADKYPKSEYAPLALYESALYAEARGEANHYQDAMTKLGQFATTYPKHPLLYQVRLLQGDLERKNNNFTTALGIYDRLLQEAPDNPDRARAELDRADCMVEQAGADPDKQEAAEAALEHLLNSPTLPVDARVEAGFKLGYMLAHNDKPDDAAQAYYQVVSRILDDAKQAGGLGSQGRFWMARCLFELADLYEQKSQFETARRLYQQVLEHGLPGQELANERLHKRLAAPTS